MRISELPGLVKFPPALGGVRIGSLCAHLDRIKSEAVYVTFSREDYIGNFFHPPFQDTTSNVFHAIARGALAVVIGKSAYERYSEAWFQIADRIIVVENTVLLLQKLAKKLLADIDIPVVGITGSAGKTTTKDFASFILSSAGILAKKSGGNFNNGIGLPLTILDGGLSDEIDVLVLEMGMSNSGEIARLCSIAPPSIGVVLNVLPVHLQYLKSIDAIARAKAELLEGMKEDGIAVLNADDAASFNMREIPSRHIAFGVRRSADVRAENIKFNSLNSVSFDLVTPSGRAFTNVNAVGVHNVSNILAAAAVGHLFGIEAGQISGILSSAKLPDRRCQVHKLRDGITLIDDTYNSNPASTGAIIEVAKAHRQAYSRIVLVVGDMLELGDASAAYHESIGSLVVQSQIDLFIAFGKYGMAAMRRFGKCDKNRFSTEDVDDVKRHLKDAILPGDLIIIKGSRALTMDALADWLIGNWS